MRVQQFFMCRNEKQWLEQTGSCSKSFPQNVMFTNKYGRNFMNGSDGKTKTVGRKNKIYAIFFIIVIAFFKRLNKSTKVSRFTVFCNIYLLKQLKKCFRYKYVLSREKRGSFFVPSSRIMSHKIHFFKSFLLISLPDLRSSYTTSRI